MIKENPEKYKYVFRTCLNAVHLVKYLAGTMAAINKEFGFDKVYVMHQDVAWARGTAGASSENVLRQGRLDHCGTGKLSHRDI